jgi:hypothetical protein
MTKSPCAKEAFFDGAALGLGAGLLKGLRSGKAFYFWTMDWFCFAILSNWTLFVLHMGC